MEKLIGEVSLKQLLEHLAFAQEETEQAATEQAKLYMAAATFRIKKMRKRQEFEMHVDNLRVDLSLKFRTKMKGQKGTTERAIGEMVEKDPDLRDAMREAAKAKRMEEYAKHLIEAYEHRRSGIKVLAQYALMQDSFSSKHEEDKMRRRRERLKQEIGKDIEE